ncbi:MAG: cupin domain-containing protein [Parvibaculum sp.]|nr:cupin domain-containing protein [Parvibaculum sp.]
MASKSLKHLGMLISPIDTSDFFENFWERRPLFIHRDDPNFYRCLLSIESIDKVLTDLNLRHPVIRLAQSEDMPNSDDYTLRDGRIDVLAVTKLFSKGATIVLDQMQRRLPTLANLCGGMEAEFGGPFQANIYLTPPNGGGFKVHYDTHDVFVLQVAGSKEWEICDSPIELPMPGQNHETAGVEPGAVTQRFTLSAGDMAYIPRGYYHKARASSDASLHITLGAMLRTWSELIIEAVSELSLRDVAFRRSLPIGFGTGRFDRSTTEAAFRMLIAKLTEEASFLKTADGFQNEFLQSRDSRLSGQLFQIVELQKLSLGSVVIARDSRIQLIEESEERIVIKHLNTTIEFPSHVSVSLRCLLSGNRLRVVDVEGNLDASGKLTLARRLIEEGLLMAIDHQDAGGDSAGN